MGAEIAQPTPEEQAQQEKVMEENESTLDDMVKNKVITDEESAHLKDYFQDQGQPGYTKLFLEGMKHMISDLKSFVDKNILTSEESNVYRKKLMTNPFTSSVSNDLLAIGWTLKDIKQLEASGNVSPKKINDIKKMLAVQPREAQEITRQMIADLETSEKKAAEDNLEDALESLEKNGFDYSALEGKEKPDRIEFYKELEKNVQSTINKLKTDYPDAYGDFNFTWSIDKVVKDRTSGMRALKLYVNVASDPSKTVSLGFVEHYTYEPGSPTPIPKTEDELYRDIGRLLNDAGDLSDRFSTDEKEEDRKKGKIY